LFGHRFRCLIAVAASAEEVLSGFCGQVQGAANLDPERNGITRRIARELNVGGNLTLSRAAPGFRARVLRTRRDTAILKSGAPMTDTVTAVYEHGVFLPDSPCDLPEGARVVLAIRDATNVAPPEVLSEEERRRILREVVERMKRNPLPPDAPRFTRDEMHERR